MESGSSVTARVKIAYCCVKNYLIRPRQAQGKMSTAGNTRVLSHETCEHLDLVLTKCEHLDLVLTQVGGRTCWGGGVGSNEAHM